MGVHHTAATSPRVQISEQISAAEKDSRHTPKISVVTDKMPCHRKKHGKRKKVIRKGKKRYYRAGKSGLVRLKGGKKAPFRRR